MREYIISAETLIKEAERALNKYGLKAEDLALLFTKAAVRLIWNHANQEIDEKYVYWITEREIHIKNMILELHDHRIREALSA